MPVRRIVGILVSVALFAAPFLVVAFIASRVGGFELQGNLVLWIAWLAYLLAIAWFVRRFVRPTTPRD
jgi:hypothetical protein